MTIICLVGGAVVVVGFGHDENVVAAPEGILEYGCGTKVDIRVMTWSLVGRRAVEVPDTEVANVCN